ncbi:MAG: HypC/HybG/HupF family hydrogenase formation chaperone [Candidatus Lernaella stagnicola]|nr:HypC/HybG/HupF family hydrogenase formation chaperone [Candidatus Lernaella stagnicola]
MCLAKPMKIISIDEASHTGSVDAGGTNLNVGLDLVPEVKIGDYVLVHAGVAIDVLLEQDARDILAAYDEFVHTGDALSPEDPRLDER